MIGKILEVFSGVYKLNDHFVINSFDKYPIIVDLGAGKGDFSVAVLRKHPFCRLVLVEPAPSLVQELTRKFENQSNVEILDAAVGNKTTNRCEFYLSKNWEGNSLYKSLIREKKDQSEIAVRMVTLRDIFSLFRLEKIDLLKVDIEGAEWDVFEEFSRHDFEKICQISVEFHDFLDPSFRKRSERCIKQLRDLGYTFVHEGTEFSYGTPYYDCLFYDRKRLRWTTVAKWLNIPKLLSIKI